MTSLLDQAGQTNASLWSMAADMLDPPMPEGRQRWRDTARPEQLAPLGDWYLWFIKAGRGWGKTRTGAEWLLEQMRRFPGSRWAMVAPTYDDGRDVMVEGESGLQACALPGEVAAWNRSLGHFIMKNGSRADLFSAEKPESVRGPNLRGVWGDEPGTWRYGQKLWDTLEFAIRKGDVQALLTGTPRPTKFVKFLISQADFVTDGSTYDNMANLSDKFRTRVIARHEGTRLGRQELGGEVLEDTPGALWTLAQIEALRKLPPMHKVWRAGKEWMEIDMRRIVVAVDPAVTSEEDSDETGIIVGGIGRDQHGYTLADYSLQASPEKWARRAIDAYYDFKADAIVAEVNNGGDLVETVIRSIDKNVRYKKVNASRGKRVRAEPVASLYEQKRWHHIEPFPELEDQMTTWVQGDPDSPDRMDANVWLATELFQLDKDGPVMLGAA